MKLNMKNIKYSILFLGLTAFLACNEPEDVLKDTNIEPETGLPILTSGTADFSKYVSLGASFTAGYTDGALFKASQNNSFPNILAEQFAHAGADEDFIQPLTNDNFGGLAVAGTRIADPRFVFGGATPVPLESLIGPVTVTTDIATNNPTGPFNNLGVPGAKSFHLLSNTYGNIAGVGTYANPYFVRMASSSNASIIEDAMAQNPTFFTLSEMGGNDVLSYAISGGSGTDQTGYYDVTTYGSNDITDPTVFSNVFNGLVTTLTSTGAKGVVTNVPYITDLPHFTTVPYAPLDPTNESFGPQIPLLNSIFGALNPIFNAVDPARAIVFSETAASPVVIKDESLTDISDIISYQLSNSPTFPAFIAQFGLPEQAVPTVATLLGTMYGQSRQATPTDLLVLPSSAIIGTVNTDNTAFLMAAGLSQTLAGQFSVEGVSLPLEDKWVLTPDEQMAIKTATDAYNLTIKTITESNPDIALVDLNSILTELASTGISFNNYQLNANLVTGGAISLDGVHLTARGYSYMAYKFLEAIDTAFGANFIASGNIPNPGDYPTNYSPTLQ